MNNSKNVTSQSLSDIYIHSTWLQNDNLVQRVNMAFRYMLVPPLPQYQVKGNRYCFISIQIQGYSYLFDGPRESDTTSLSYCHHQQKWAEMRLYSKIFKGDFIRFQYRPSYSVYSDQNHRIGHPWPLSVLYHKICTAENHDRNLSFYPMRNSFIRKQQKTSMQSISLTCLPESASICVKCICTWLVGACVYICTNKHQNTPSCIQHFSDTNSHSQ